MEEVREFTLVGYYHFNSKDQTKTYYIVQCLTNKQENLNNNKGIILNVFVEREIYAEIIKKSVGEVVNVKIGTNLETGKIKTEIIL